MPRSHKIATLALIAAAAAFSQSLSNQTFKAPATGAVPRTGQDKLADTVNALDFGVDPTGATVSTTAMQNAVNYAIANAKVLELPDGLIKIADAINIIATAACNFSTTGTPLVRPCGLTMRGHGIGKTIIWQSAAGKDAFSAAPGAPQYPSYDFEGFALYGSDKGTCPGSSGNGIYISSSVSGTPQRVSMRNLYVLGFCGSGKSGVWLDGPEGFILDNVRVDYSDRGVKLTGSANDGTFENVKASSNYTAGFDFAGVVGGHFSGLSAQGTHCDGMRLQGVFGAVFSGLYFENNNGAGNCYALNLLQSVQNNHITGLNLETLADTLGITGASGTINLATRNWFFNGQGVFGSQGHVTINNSFSIGNFWVNYLNPGSFQNTNATGTAGAGVTSIAVTSLLPIYQGQTVTGANIQAGTTVTSVSGSVGAGYTLGISLATSGALAATPLTFAGAAGLSSEVFIGQSGASAAVSFTPVLSFGNGTTPPGCTQPSLDFSAGGTSGDYIATNGLIAMTVQMKILSLGTCTGSATITGMPASSVLGAEGAVYANNAASTRTGLSARMTSTGLVIDITYGAGGTLNNTDFSAAPASVLRASISYHQ